MPRRSKCLPTALSFAAILACCLAGCTSPIQYFKNGFKVGEPYCPPPAPVAERWIDAAYDPSS
jgi:hypothetical protein